MVVKVCEVCGKEFEARGRAKRCSPECSKEARKEYKRKYDQSEARKEYKRKYNQTEAGKDSQRKYRQTEAGKEYHRKYQRKYYQTEAHKEYQRKYQQSEAYKEYHRKYNQSEAGKESQRKYRQTEAGKENNRKYEIEVRFPRLQAKYRENGYNFETREELNFARLHWSQVVKTRDNNTCQRCGSTLDPEAHHLIPVSQDISKSLDPANGETLCASCHRTGEEAIHHLFKLEYTLEQFNKWLQSYTPIDKETEQEQILLDEFME